MSAVGTNFSFAPSGLSSQGFPPPLTAALLVDFLFMRLYGTRVLLDEGLLSSQESLDSVWVRTDNLVSVCTQVRTIRARGGLNCAGT